MKLLKVLFLILGIVVLLVISGILYVKFALPDVGSAPDIQVSRDSSSIERGKYLANHVAACMDCHSQRDWGLFSGPVPPGREGGGGEKFGREEGFPGEVYSTNITPYKLAAWSDGEIYRAITSGVSKNGRALFPVMGYHRFGHMDKQDVYDIIAYLRTIPAVPNDVPEAKLDFPVNLLNNLSPAPAAHQPRPSPADTVRYGAYLVNAAGCVDCHSKRSRGTVVPGSEFGGGMEFRQAVGIIRSPNITMDRKTGIGTWTKDIFVSKFKAFSDTSYHAVTLGKEELNTPMPWTMYAGMTREDLQAIYAYLKTIEPKVSPIKIRSYDPPR